MPAVAKEPSQFSDSSIWLLLEPPLLAGAETVRATWLVTTQFGHWSWSPTVVDTNNGFVLRGDYQLGTGVSFLIASRQFQVGPLPERMDSFADENFKIVLAGGGDEQFV